MMKNSLISIIVPVYKVEFWLPKCIKSLLKQTYKSLEILLIDDGSPDACPKICDKFARKDKRVRVIHKKNGGVSSARNRGIEEATGEYVFFVDSDDWLGKNAIELAYNAMIEHGAQLSVLDFEIVGLKNKLYAGKLSPRKVDFSIPDNAFYDLNNAKISEGICGKLFKLDIIKNNNIKFDEKIKYAEDSLFLLKYFSYCTVIYMVYQKGYYYNRLVGESAITKYYDDIQDWMLNLSKERKKLVNNKACDGVNGEYYVREKALVEFEFLLNYYFLHIKDSEEVKKCYRNAYEKFCLFLNGGPIDENTIERQILGNIYGYCDKGNFEGLYQYIKERQKCAVRGRAHPLKKIVKKIYRSWRIFIYRYLMQ